MNKKLFLCFCFVLFTLVFSFSVFTGAKAEAFTFNNNLRSPVNHPDVLELQKFLNSHGFVIVTTGPGSVGHETTTFGPVTKAALIKFQIVNKIVPPSGFFGPLTRSIVNKLISGAGNNVANTNSTTACKTGDLFNALTGQPCTTTVPGTLSTTTFPAGCTSALGFSLTTGYSCATGLPVTHTTGGGGGGSGSTSYGTRIDIAAISGITAPVKGATPTATITATDEYTATISWNGNPTTFGPNRIYIATITITPKSGYTLHGVARNFFTVVGATSVSNSIASGIVTATFPATDRQQLIISSPTITLSKTYNGNRTAVVTAGSLTGIYSPDVVTVSAVSNYDNKNVGVGKTIVTVYTLGGAAADNYIKPIDYTVTNGVITTLNTTASFTTFGSRTYDADIDATVDSRTVDSAVLGDDVSLTGGTATFADKNVGSDKVVTLAGATLTGTDAGNYHLTAVSTTTAYITPLDTTGSFIVASKPYDGSTDADLLSRVVDNVIEGDDVTLSGGTASYDDQNVGIGIVVRLTGATLTGTDADNYNLTSVSTTTADITPAEIASVNIAGFTAPETSKSPMSIMDLYKDDPTYEITDFILNPTDNPYNPNEDYTATVVLTSNENYKFPAGGLTPSVDGGGTAVLGTTTGTGSGNTLTFDVTFDTTLAYATAPDVELDQGTSRFPTIDSDVELPLPGATDSSGIITGWVPGSADTIAFNVTDNGSANSDITINNEHYTSGYNYTILNDSDIVIRVVTNETDKEEAVRTFHVSVRKAYAVAPSLVTLTTGGYNGVTVNNDVVDPGPNGTDHTGSVTNWSNGARDTIAFTVTDTAPAVSTIKIYDYFHPTGAVYSSGSDYQIIGSDILAGHITIVVTTTQANKTTAIRTFVITLPGV
jgi:hypothetical protein